MSLVAAAVCPQPPLLVPAVAAGAAAETDEVRTACRHAVKTLLDADPGLVVVVGDAPETLAYSSADAGTFAGYGVALDVPLGPRLCAGQPILPLSLTVGAWLLADHGWSGDRQGYGVSGFTSPDDAARIGRELATLDERVALLVMGDGSYARDEKAPGYVDGRAGPFDARVALALGDVDRAALLALDDALARELGAAGRASWQVLAGAADDAEWVGRVLYDAAPYGVGYLVATWVRR